MTRRADRWPLLTAFALSSVLHAGALLALRTPVIRVATVAQGSRSGPILVQLYEIADETAGPGPRGPALSSDPGSRHDPSATHASVTVRERAPESHRTAASLPSHAPQAPRVERPRSDSAAPEPARVASRAPAKTPPIVGRAEDDARAGAGAAVPAPPVVAAVGGSASAATSGSASSATVRESSDEAGLGTVGGLGASAPASAATLRVSYARQLSAWLERFKEYPVLARKRGVQGEGEIRVRIDRRGHVIARSLERATGEEMLDKAALDMVARADPFPPMPASYAADHFEFLAPIEFRLRSPAETR